MCLLQLLTQSISMALLQSMSLLRVMASLQHRPHVQPFATTGARRYALCMKYLKQTVLSSHQAAKNREGSHDTQCHCVGAMQHTSFQLACSMRLLLMFHAASRSARAVSH